MKIIVFVFLFLISPYVKAQKVSGIADLHVHMFAHQGFAGAWFLGDPAKDKYEDMFLHCKNNENWPWLKGVFNKIDPYISTLLFRNHCVPKNVSFLKDFRLRNKV